MGDEHYYRRKTKDILVIDCVYLSTERDRIQKELNESRREVDALSRRLAAQMAKVRCFAHVNGKLTEAVTGLRDGMIIGTD